MTTDHCGKEDPVLPNRFHAVIAALNDNLITKTDLKVLSGLCEYADDRGRARLSISTLARLAGTRDNRISPSLARLRTYGYVEVVERGVHGRPTLHRMTRKGVDQFCGRGAASIELAAPRTRGSNPTRADAAIKEWIESPPRGCAELAARLGCSSSTASNLVRDLANSKRLVKIGRWYGLVGVVGEREQPA